jgi:hypothetical protein
MFDAYFLITVDNDKSCYDRIIKTLVMTAEAAHENAQRQ